MASAATARIQDLRNAVVELGRLSEESSCTPLKVTLLELVEAVSSITEDDREIVATVVAMLTRGRVKLQGSFREEPIKNFAE